MHSNPPAGLSFAEKLGILGFALALLTFAWKLWEFYWANRVHLTWTVTRGDSVEHPAGFVEIVLTNKMRFPVLVDQPAVFMSGPPIGEAVPEQSAQDARRLTLTWPQRRAMKRAMYYSKWSRRGDDEAVKLEGLDSKIFTISHSNAERNRWPKDRSGVRISTRDGRAAEITWAEIDRQPTWWSEITRPFARLRWLRRD